MWALVRCHGLDVTEWDHYILLKAQVLSLPAEKYANDTMFLLSHTQQLSC